MRRLCVIATVLSVLLSCSREAPIPPVGNRDGGLFALSIEEGWGEPLRTKSCLGTPSTIESKLTSVCLGIYRGGNLYDTKYFTSSLGAMPLRLDNGDSYTIYSLVNMGDVRSLFPALEMDVPDLTWALSSFTNSSSGVVSRGIPMAGSLEYTAGSGGTTVIPVKRLLAKVTLSISCDWPGGSISRASICQANGRLLPFGTSAARSDGDMTEALEDYETGLSGTSASVVLYVPENMQGDAISSIPNASYKSPDRNSWVEANIDRLTYLEVEVTGSGLYDGSMVYRHLLGNNATTNFDIRRNCAYTWTLRYDEGHLSFEDWKHDSTGLDDLRELSVAFPIYAVLCQDLSLSNYTTTNMDLGDITYGVLDDGNAGIYEIYNGDDLTGVTFSVDGHGHYDEYHPIELEVYPANNGVQWLYNNGYVYLCEGDLTYVNETTRLTGQVYNNPSSSWVNEGTAGKKAYFVLPGGKRNVELQCRYDYINEDGDDVYDYVTGQYGLTWTAAAKPATGISATYKGEGSGYDQFQYSVTAATTPGNYPIRPTALDYCTVGTEKAYIHVHDSRHLRWLDASSVVPSAGTDFGGYRYLCSNKILVFLPTGSANVATTGMTFTSANTPFRFVPNDRSGKVKLTMGVPFEGTTALNASSWASHITATYPTGMSTKESWRLNRGSTSAYMGIGLNPNVGSTALTTGKYTVTLSCKKSYDEATRHAIDAVIIVGNGNPWRELFLDPCDKKITAGASITFQPKMFGVRVSGYTLTQGATSNVSRTSCTWSVYPSAGWSGSNGVYTFTKPGNYRVTCTYSTYSITAYADVEVTNNDIDLSSDWDEEDPTILD